MGTDGGWGINLQDFSRIFPGKKVTFVKTWISKSFLDFRKKIRGMTSPGFWWGSTSHVIFVVDVCFFWVIFYALLHLCWLLIRNLKLVQDFPRPEDLVGVLMTTNLGLWQLSAVLDSNSFSRLRSQ